MITIKHFDGINRTPAVKIAVEGWHELLIAGLAEPMCLLGYDNQAVVALDADGEPIGVIIWVCQKWSRSAEIVLGYVRSCARRQGVYGAMFKGLVEQARDRGLVQVTGGTYTTNQPMRAAAKALGRSEIGVLLRFAIPPQDEAFPALGREATVGVTEE